MNTKLSKRVRTQGATLVELVVAMGIVVTIMIPLLGMLSMGMETNRKAINLTVGARITEQLMGELQQADWAMLDKWIAQNYYFDDLGLKLTGANANEKAVYVARVVAPAGATSTSGLTMAVKPSGVIPNTWERQFLTLAVSATAAQGITLLDAAADALKNKKALSPRVYVGRALLTNLEKKPAT